MLFIYNFIPYYSSLALSFVLISEKEFLKAFSSLNIEFTIN